MLEATQ